MYVGLVLLTIYLFIINLKVDFEEYLLKAFTNLLKRTIIYITLIIGIVLIWFLFTTLILDGFSEGLLIRLLILTVGFYYVPITINSLTSISEEPTKFFKVLICILFACSVIATFIVCIYIIKIILLGNLENILGSDIPIQAILWLFILAFPILIMTYYFKENKVMHKINKICILVYIPFIIVEIYYFIGTHTYGITVSLYEEFMLILFQIIFITLFIYKNGKHLDKSLIVAAIIIAIMEISPVSADKISIMSQESIIQKYVSDGIEIEDLNEDDLEIYADAYGYLQKVGDDEFLNNVLTTDEQDKFYIVWIWGYSYYQEKYENDEDDEEGEKINSYYKHVYSCNIDVLDVSDYKKIYTTDVENISDTYITLLLEESSVQVTCDLSEILKKITQGDITSKDVAIASTDSENYDIYIKSLSYYYYKGVYSDMHITAYVLEK